MTCPRCRYATEVACEQALAVNLLRVALTEIAGMDPSTMDTTYVVEGIALKALTSLLLLSTPIVKKP